MKDPPSQKNIDFFSILQKFKGHDKIFHYKNNKKKFKIYHFFIDNL